MTEVSAVWGMEGGGDISFAIQYSTGHKNQDKNQCAFAIFTAKMPSRTNHELKQAWDRRALSLKISSAEADEGILFGGGGVRTWFFGVGCRLLYSALWVCQCTVDTGGGEGRGRHLTCGRQDQETVLAKVVRK